MTTTQWIFEYLALRKKEKEHFQLMFKAAKHLLVGVFGLNGLRPEDDKGIPKSHDEMTDDEREAFLPLVAWVGRPEMLKAVKDQIDKEIEFTTIRVDETYEKLIEQIDAADGDMEPILGLPQSEYMPVPDGKIVDPMYQEAVRQLIREYPADTDDSESDIDVEGKI